MPPTQGLPFHILRFLSSYHGDYTLYNGFAQRGLDKCSDYWQSLVNDVDPKSPLSIGCGHFELSADLSTIKHADSGMCVFAAQREGKGKFF